MAELTDELRAFLSERRYAVLATHDDDRIHLTPIWFLFEDDRFYFGSSSGSRKVANLRRNSSASVVVDTRDPGKERWVAASGTVELVTGEEAQAINARIHSRYLTPAALADERIGPVFAAGDDAALELTPSAWAAWAVDAESFGGRLGPDSERWFLPVER